MAAYDKSTLTVQQLTQAVTDSVVGYKDSAKQAAETVRPKVVSVVSLSVYTRSSNWSLQAARTCQSVSRSLRFCC